MSGSWLGWLAKVLGIWDGSPFPGTHASVLEELRLGALFEKERRKPPGQRDEELVHALTVQYRKRQLLNAL